MSIDADSAKCFEAEEKNEIEQLLVPTLEVPDNIFTKLFISKEQYIVLNHIRLLLASVSNLFNLSGYGLFLGYMILNKYYIAHPERYVDNTTNHF